MLKVRHRSGCGHNGKLLSDGPPSGKVAQQLSGGSGEQLLISGSGTRAEEAANAHLLTGQRHGDSTQRGRHLPPQSALSTESKRDRRIKAHSGENARSPNASKLSDSGWRERT